MRRAVLESEASALTAPVQGFAWERALRAVLLLFALVLFALHFFHLKADFPNDSPWMDWSKYTDEGWYGDAAIRHFLFGHWRFPGDFNAAVALPVWPLIEAAVFRFTGVSVSAARALTLLVFALMLWALYCLVERFPRVDRAPGERSLAAPLLLLLLCASPFFYVFERMAILEPLLGMLTALALLAASAAVPWQERARLGRGRVAWPLAALAVLLPAMVLTKTTAVALVPAVAFLLWYRAGYRVRPALMLLVAPVLGGAALWGAYFFFLVRPHYLTDYRYLFSANAYTGFQLEPLATVIANTVKDGHWMGEVLYPAFFVLIVVAIFARPRFFRNPLVPSLLLWTAGYYAFLAYHNNLQPRYYLVPAVPITALVALAIEEFRHTAGRGKAGRRGAAGRGAMAPRPAQWVRGAVMLALVSGIVVPDTLEQIDFVRHPEYTFWDAAQGVARVVRADANHSKLILSISGSDITFMTGLPSICDDFGTLDLDQRVKQYRPGWYATWNELDDDKMDALTLLFHPVRVAAFPAMDDPDRNLLILYRLDPATVGGSGRRRRQKTPRPLRTKLGQQPTTTQLQH